MLTLREFEVYMLIVEHAEGTEQIAKELGIARSTAHNHIASILSKMNMGSTLELLVQYHRKEAA